MRHQGLLELLQGVSGLREVAEGVRPGSQYLVYGLSGSQKNCWAAALALQSIHPLLLVTADSGEARRAAEDLRVFLAPQAVGYFPAGEAAPLDVYARSLELVSQRLGVLQGLEEGRMGAVVTTIDALVESLLPVEVFRSSLLRLQRGDIWERDALAMRLVELGYLRVELVDAPGQFAVRGGVMDLYPLSARVPVRVDFFDDEIESLRAFDVLSQRSVEEMDSLQVGPARELLLTPEARSHGYAALEQDYRQAVGRLQARGRREAARRLAERLEEYLAQLSQDAWSDGLEQFRAYFYPRPANLLDYFRQQPLAVLDEPARLEERLERREREQAEFLSHLLESGNALPGQSGRDLTYQQVLKRIQPLPVVGLTLLPKRGGGLHPQQLLGVEAKTMPSFQGKLELLVEELRAWKKNRYAVVLLSNSQETAQALQQALWAREVEATLLEDVHDKPLPGQILISWGQLQKGFELPRWRLAVVSASELSSRPRPARSRPAFKEGTRITAFSDLKAGDYVVHAQHGIGRYLGLEKLEVQGLRKDYLVIQYAGEDRLYVPTDQVEQVNRYVGAEGHTPRLNKLGGSEWVRTRQKVQSAVREMAEELLALYAARRAVSGHAFASDTPWQGEFENNFPYEETPDQLRAITEVKQDMESPRVMDRLLCGDVGYGKTEVALRAAFKAVMDNKQVAVLVPTTVLAQQHFQNFRERFSGFPVRVAVLSRFRSLREQQDVLAGLGRGDVDVVVGTHRLLSGDVRFRKLGLVIVDEEQRFGVAHKERLKVLCQNVDVLTLTATPIPRTLQMALSGVRDMSTIETPPEDRYPVQTYVLEYNYELVRDAILRELDRGGQVYYLHNRVADLERVAATLRDLVPEARWAVAHGQMREDELEQVMVDFMEGSSDVLLCTTIVENGLDISNVNTLIVEDSDQLGLSQLYQLRGRVGRTNRLAYAYFTYRRDRVLSEVAEKRLAAIREFTEFGSGFKIALRDLEIRGAGNLLGPEQHGHMLAVGFDLYMRMLQEAVEELQGKPEKPVGAAMGPSVELPVDAYVSDSYLAESGLKMDLYQRLTLVHTLPELAELEAELRDRYGDPPQGVLNLLALARIRLLAEQARVREVQHQKGEVVLVFQREHGLRGEKLLRLAQHFSRRLSFSAAGGLSISVRVAGLPQEAVLSLLERLFAQIAALAAEEAG